jgi:hypothetical protein
MNSRIFLSLLCRPNLTHQTAMVIRFRGSVAIREINAAYQPVASVPRSPASRLLVMDASKKAAGFHRHEELFIVLLIHYQEGSNCRRLNFATVLARSLLLFTSDTAFLILGSLLKAYRTASEAPDEMAQEAHCLSNQALPGKPAS